MFFRNITITPIGSLIKQVAKQVKDQNIHSNADRAPTVVNELPTNSKSHTLLLSYTEQKGEHLIGSLRKDMHRTLPENVRARICYTGTKLGTKFNNIKDPVKKIPSTRCSLLRYMSRTRPCRRLHL